MFGDLGVIKHWPITVKQKLLTGG